MEMNSLTDSLIDQCDEIAKRYEASREMQVRAKKAVEESIVKLGKVNKDRQDLTKAGLFLRAVSDHSRQRSIGQIETTINAALRQIFAPRDIRVKVEFDTKAGRINANVLMVNGEGEAEDILEGRGGGIRDIVSVILRIMFKKMVHPPLSGPIVLDESLRFLNSVDNENGYVVRAYQFLKEIAERFDEQFIIVTSVDSVVRHGRTMDAIDRMFMVRLENGQSVAEVTYDSESETAY